MARVNAGIEAIRAKAEGDVAKARIETRAETRAETIAAAYRAADALGIDRDRFALALRRALGQ